MESYILIVDDDKDIRNLLGIYLRNEGLQTIKCDSAFKALEVLKTNTVDLVLLDIMMPGMDGMEACMKIRQNYQMPIIFMSAKAEDMDKINGFATGCDDYIVKPFHPMELVMRVKAQLKRYQQYHKAALAAVPELLEYEEVSLNSSTRQVWVSGEEVRLTRKEFDILELLLKNQGIVFSIERIYERIWREPFLHSETTVMMHIANLREKLSVNGDKQSIIKTVWGSGYKI